MDGRTEKRENERFCSLPGEVLPLSWLFSAPRELTHFLVKFFRMRPDAFQNGESLRVYESEHADSHHHIPCESLDHKDAIDYADKH